MVVIAVMAAPAFGVPGELWADIPWNTTANHPTTKPATPPVKPPEKPPEKPPVKPPDDKIETPIPAPPTVPTPKPPEQPVTPPIALSKPAPVEFLTVESTQRYYWKMQDQGQAGNITSEVNNSKASSSNPIEREELSLLLALLQLRANQLDQAAKSFTELEKSSHPLVALTAKRYGLLMASNADVPASPALYQHDVFVKACKARGEAELKKAKDLSAKATAMPAKNIKEWQKAWAVMADARRSLDVAITMDETVPNFADAVAAISAARDTMAQTGIKLLKTDVDQLKNMLYPSLGQLKRNPTGQVVPANALAEANVMIQAILDIESRMRKIAAQTGDTNPTDSPLAAVLDKISLVALPLNVDGTRLYRQLAGVMNFKPEAPTATGADAAKMYTIRLKIIE